MESHRRIKSISSPWASNHAASCSSFDIKSRQFVSFLPGIFTNDVAFSPDGQWIAYVSQPDLTLWRSRPDGSERQQLTSSPHEASLPQWSADGKQITYMGTQTGPLWKIFVLPATGGVPQEILPVTGERRIHVVPRWDANRVW